MQDQGRAFLRSVLEKDKIRWHGCLAAWTALMDAEDTKLDVAKLVAGEPVRQVRVLAIERLVRQGRVPNQLLPLAGIHPEMLPALSEKVCSFQCQSYLRTHDPYLHHAVVLELVRRPSLLGSWTAENQNLGEARVATAIVLAHRASGRAESLQLIPSFLTSPEENMRFLAVKWIADEKLAQFRPQIVEGMKDPKLNVRMYLAYATALARIDGQEVSEARLADYFLERLHDPQAAPGLRTLALQMVPATHKKLTLDLLAGFLAQEQPALQLEAVRALSEHPSGQRFPELLAAARNPKLGAAVRAQALVGLADRAADLTDDLLAFAGSKEPALRDEALRSLTGTKLTEKQRASLAGLKENKLAARVLGQPFADARPAPDQIDAWLARLGTQGDPAAGQRVFFQPNLAGCFRCHRVEGRGQDIGPDLSTIGQMPRRNLLESLLQPNNQIAPHYQVWSLLAKDGKSLTGMIVHTHLDETTYVDPKGAKFKLKTGDIEESQAVATSIMPTGLVDVLTADALRDLLAYLASRR